MANPEQETPGRGEKPEPPADSFRHLGDDRNTPIDSPLALNDSRPGDSTAFTSETEEKHKRAEEALRDSEERFRALSAAAFEGIAVSENGRLIDANDQFLRMVGYDRAELIGMAVESMISPEDRERVMSNIRAEQDSLIGHTLIRKDGGRIFVEARGRTIDYHGGRIRFTAMRDLTERRREEENLRKVNETLEAIIASSPVAVIALDPEGKVTLWNPAAERIFGWTAAEALGRFNPIVPPDKRDEFLAHLEPQLKGGAFKAIERRRQRKDGSFVDVRLHGAALYDNAHRVRGVMGVIEDITDRKRAEEAMRESARLQKAILDNIPDPAWLKDREGRFLAANEAWCRWASLELSQVIGRKNQDLLDPVRCETFDRQDEEVVRSGKPLRMEESLPDKDGNTHWFETIKSPIFDEQGEVMGTVGIGRETTDRKRVEESLQRVAAIIENSSDLMGIRDLKTGYNLLNPAGLAMVGYDIADKKTLTVEEAHPPEDAERIRTVCIPEALEKGIWRGDNRLRHRDGHIIPVEQVIFPVRDKNQHLIGVATIMRDVTNRLRAEEERAMLQAQLRQSQKLEAVGLLAGGVAHEFNNLLTIILGNSDCALQAVGRKDESLGPIAEDALNAIRSAAERAAILTRQLLTFSRKQDSLQAERINLREVVTSMEDMLRQTIGETIQLKVISDPNEDCVLANAIQIEQVVLNLAINARDAMPRGGIITIEVATVTLNEEYVAHHSGSKPGPHIMIAVSDTGTGMDEQTQSHLFEPFFTTKPVGKGTGLGLATVYGVVQQAEGHIQVRSTLGEGSTFRLFFPAVHETAVIEDQRAPDSIGGTETILLCDDNALVRRVVRHTLENKDYHVLEAESGPDAIRLAAEYDGPIHLLVTDLVMPEMNGYELAEALKKGRGTIKLLFMSGYAPEALDAHIPSVGEAWFLQKPFMPKDLLCQVRQALDNP